MTDVATPGERLHGVEPVMQPARLTNPGGDCFACATLATIRHFWPEEAEDITVAEVVEWWRTMKNTNGEAVMGNHIDYADRALRNLPDPFELDVMTDPFVPLIDDHTQMRSPVWGVRHYADRIEAYLAAGYVGMTTILFAPPMPRFIAPKDGGGYWNTSTDHMVLIDGIRTVVEGDEEPYGAHVDELHVVCSVKGAYWIDERPWLRSFGGTFIWWMRPRRVLPWRKKEREAWTDG